MRVLNKKLIERLETHVAAAKREPTAIVYGVYTPDRELIRCWRLTPAGPIPTNDAPNRSIPVKLEKLLFRKRLKIVYGGRGSAKTRSIVSILADTTTVKKTRVLALREIQKSLADSSYQELQDEVERTGREDEFKFIKDRIRIPSRRSSFAFEGLFRNQTKVKGHAGDDIAWVEEAENVSRDSWDYLVPTIRAEGSEIWVSFNPREEHDPTWSDFVEPFVSLMVDGVYEDENLLIIQCNHSDNPWLTPELKLERDKMAARDPDRYAWIWEGQFRKVSDVKVFNGKWSTRAFVPLPHWSGPYFGADFGFAADPSTLIKCWVGDDRLWIEYEAWGKGVELDEMGDLYDEIPGSAEHKIRGDSSRPETISHLKKARKRKNGEIGKAFKMESVEKWPGSVEDGITFLRSFEEIVIHPRCPKTIEEATRYEYKTDRLTGDILPDIVDAFNHCWDAIRYALAPLIKKKGRGFFHVGKN